MGVVTSSVEARQNKEFRYGAMHIKPPRYAPPIALPCSLLDDLFENWFRNEQ
jgi:hypothetical protein